MHNCSRTLPGSVLTSADRIDLVIDFWNGLRVSNDPGSTNWEVLEDLERQVTDCLYSSLVELNKAERLTAQAMLLMTGELEI
jgi:hypothetical protein